MVGWRIHKLGLLVLLSAGVFTRPPLAYSTNQLVNDERRVPRIKQVAIMPVYWQSVPTGEAAQKLKKQIDKNFSPIVRSSKRFYFPNDEITAELWSNPDGRQELAENYEIDGILGLSIKTEGDLLLWTVRLMSPNLTNYLVESDRVPVNWAMAASEEELDERLKALLFRTLNRYPIDVFVTSSQGNYLTLSGGKQQLVFEGDQLEFYQTTVKSQHPIDGSWLSFNRKRLGTAKVIESNEQSSIAKLSSLAFEDAIKVGDGATIPASATRRAFQKPAPEAPQYNSIAGSPLINVEGTPRPRPPTLPRKDEVKVATGPEQIHSQPSEPLPKPTSPVAENSAGAINPAEPESQTEATESAPESIRESLEEDQNRPAKFVFPSHLQILATSDSFKFSGAASAQSQTSSLLLNSFRARSFLDISSDIRVGGEFGFRFGSTTKGDYSGFSMRAEPLYKISTLSSLLPSLDAVLVGANIRYDSLGVTKQTFGGWDVLSIAPSVHLTGSTHLPDEELTVDFDLSMKLGLLSSGTAGIRGKKRDLESFILNEWEFLMTLRTGPQEIEWGGVIGGRSGNGKVGTKGLAFETLGFGLSAKLTL